MKKIIFTIILVFAAFVIGLKLNADKSILKIVLDRNTTKAGLAEIIENAKSVNMQLTIDEAGYDTNGKLENIRGTVDFGDRGSGSFGSDKVGKIILKRDLNSVNGGFSIVVKKRWI